jgi:hypothetical protein
MKTWLRRLQCLVLLVSACCSAQTQSISQPQYSVTIAPSDQPGAPPQLKLERQHETIFQIPIFAGLASSTSEEQLSNITYSLRKTSDDAYELTATAKSNLWTSRRFQWRFLSDHIEFQQFATGSGKLGRCYFLANGVSNRWDNGTTSGHAWDATIYADRYFAPNPNLADQSEFNIAMPQILGFSVGREESSEQDFRPERMAGTFAPPPLFLAFHLNSTWTGIGIGAKPGDYQFPALEYSGSRYAGASFYVDYMGYRTIDGDFASPVLTINMAYSPLDALRSYTAWLTANGFATDPVTKDVYWHHLPIFCGWAEQTVESVPQGGSANKLSTQANYEKWLATLEERGLPVGTVVIDDKWQQGYGSFDVDQQKWPDFKGFIAAQHAKGRHVVLWVPVADIDGLPPSLCVNYQGKCVIADVGKPEYEAFLRPRIRHLVQDLGVDGFKEDWVRSPAAPGLPLWPRYRHRIRPPLPVHPLQRNAQVEARRDGRDANHQRALPRIIGRHPPQRHLVRQPQCPRDDAPPRPHGKHHRLAPHRYRQRLRHQPERVVELHAGAALHRNPRPLFRHPHRNHTGNSIRSRLDLPRSPLASIHRWTENENAAVRTVISKAKPRHEL